MKKLGLLVLLVITTSALISGCKLNTAQGETLPPGGTTFSAAQAKDRLAAFKNGGSPTPGTTFVHTEQHDEFPVNFPRTLSATERKLVGTWSNKCDSPFAEGPTEICFTFKSNGSLTLTVHGDTEDNWNGGPISPWQVENGVLSTPNVLPFTYEVNGNTLVLTVTDPNSRVKSMTLYRK